MIDNRMLLKAFISRQGDLGAPAVAPVDFQVRTGISVPSKPDMINMQLVVVTWRYRVKDPASFSKDVSLMEQPLTGSGFEGSDELRNWRYHGTFLVNSTRAIEPGTAETIWSSKASDLAKLKAIVANPQLPIGSFEEKVRNFVLDLKAASIVAPGLEFDEEILSAA